MSEKRTVRIAEGIATKYDISIDDAVVLFHGALLCENPSKVVGRLYPFRWWQRPRRYWANRLMEQERLMGYLDD